MPYIPVGLAAGILMGSADGLINANPPAQRLYAVYRPVARQRVNVAAAVGYRLVAGPAKMLLVGVLCGATLRR